MRLGDRLRQQFPARSGNRGLQRADDDAAEAPAPERTRKSYDGDDRLHEYQRARVGQGSCMAEPVGHSQPHECILEQLAAAARTKNAPGIVAFELPGFGDRRRRAQLVASGTHTVSAGGRTLIRKRRTFLRFPLSSSYGILRASRTSNLRPRAVSTKGEDGALPVAARASVLDHCHSPLAVTTPISS